MLISRYLLTDCKCLKLCWPFIHTLPHLLLQPDFKFSVLRYIWSNRVLQNFWKLIRNFIRIANDGLSCKQNLSEFTVTLCHSICHLQSNYFLIFLEVWEDRCFRFVVISATSFPREETSKSSDFQMRLCVSVKILVAF